LINERRKEIKIEMIEGQAFTNSGVLQDLETHRLKRLLKLDNLKSLPLAPTLWSARRRHFERVGGLSELPVPQPYECIHNYREPGRLRKKKRVGLERKTGFEGGILKKLIKTIVGSLRLRTLVRLKEISEMSRKFPLHLP